MNKEFTINSNEITNIIDIYDENHPKYRIATTNDLDAFIHEKTEEYINQDNKHVSKILKTNKVIKITNVLYEIGLLINLFLCLFYKISLLTYFIIFASLVFIRCLISFFIKFQKDYAEFKIRDEILQVVQDGMKMDVFNVHIPLKNANMEPYSNIVKLIEKNNIYFPGLVISGEYYPAENLDIRSKIDFLKTTIEYNDNNDGISLLCVEHK